MQLGFWKYFKWTAPKVPENTIWLLINFNDLVTKYYQEKNYWSPGKLHKRRGGYKNPGNHGLISLTITGEIMVYFWNHAEVSESYKSSQKCFQMTKTKSLITSDQVIISWRF